MHIIKSFSGRVTGIDELLEEPHLDLATSNLQLANARERKFDITIRLHAPVEHLEYVTHAQFDLIARKRGLVGDRRVVERVHGYGAGDRVFCVGETVGLRELLGYGEHGTLNEHVLVLTADVELLLHETKRAKIGYAHALRLTHVFVNVRRDFVPNLNHIL